MKTYTLAGLVSLALIAGPVAAIASADPVVSSFQAPAEDVNTLHPGEQTSIYGTNIDSSYKAVIKNSSITKTADLSTYGGAVKFVTPNLNSGTYEAYVEKAGTMSNKISVTVVSSEYFPVAQLEVTPTSVGFTYTAQKLSNDEREAQIMQIQTLLAQLIQQLIQLLQQGAR